MSKTEANARNKTEAQTQVVPITQEEHHHLVLENEYVRVFHVEVAPHSETKFHKHDYDYVFVTLGDSVVESERVGEKAVKLELKDGDTRFTKGGFAHKAVNLSDKPFVNVTVELKKNRGDGLPHGESGGCFGLVCDFAIFTTQQTRCRQYSSGGSGNGLGLLDSRPRLLVSLSEIQIGDETVETKKGEIRWITGPLRLSAKKGEKWAVVCEFARPGEDFLAKNN